MKPYSPDLRERVVSALEKGDTQKAVAERFQVSLSTVKRYARQRREQVHLRPKPIMGRPPIKRATLQENSAAQLEEQPDATLQEHGERWKARSGMQVSRSTISRAIAQLGWTRKKKTLAASERKDEEREQWQEMSKSLDASKLVFVDESGTNIALTRLYARAEKGERAFGSTPRNRGKNITLIASLSAQGIGEACTLDGASNTEIFETYIE